MNHTGSHEKNLTLFEASAVVAGLGVGGGIMAVPYLASLNGVLNILGITLIAYVVSVVLHLMIAEIVLTDGKGHQLVELFGKYIFRGRGGIIFTWIFFLFIVLSFLSLSAGYIVGCGELMRNLLGTPLWMGEILTYILSAGVVLFGLKAIGMSEKYAIIGIAVLLVVLSLCSMNARFIPLLVIKGEFNGMLALFGMVMLSFACFFSVPQAVEGLSWNKKMVPRAIIIGLGINLIFTLLVTMMALLTSEPVTEVAIIGWGKAVGNWINILGSLFVILAILTSYWSASYALMIVIRERMHLNDRLSWVLATLPSLIMALSNLTGFLGYLRITGGAMAIILAVMIVPTLRAVRRHCCGRAQWGRYDFCGSVIVQGIIVMAYVLAAQARLSRSNERAEAVRP